LLEGDHSRINVLWEFFFLQVFPNCCGYLYVGFSQKNKDGLMGTPLALEEMRILEWDLHCG